MERRDFLKSTCLTCTGSISASWLIQACTPQKYITTVPERGNKLVIKKTEFTLLKKGKPIQQKFILIKPDNTQFPIVIYQLKENEYKALYLQCTHQGCELTPHETMLVCPCHGAEFNIHGEVITGPADISLTSFITTTDHENIYIQR